MLTHEKYWLSLVLENKKFVSAHCVVFKNGKVLILKRSPTDEWMPGHYGLPGGKLDGNETPKQAIKRECKEEANITVDQDKLIFLPKVSAHHEHAFYYTDSFSGEPELDHEHDDFKWVEPKELFNLKIVPDLIDIINAAVEDLGKNSKK